MRVYLSLLILIQLAQSKKNNKHTVYYNKEVEIKTS